jgi:Protein of unknown function (DUF664)
MTDDRGKESDDATLLAFLQGQRDAVLSIVDGLDEDAWHRSIVPTGWTPAGMVAHLGGAEWHWFQGVVAGVEPELPGDLEDDMPPYDPMTVVFEAEEPSSEVVAFYKEQCARSDAVLAEVSLSATPKGLHGLPGSDEPPNVRWVVLHMIEETARHAGHLDIARELMDGQARRGQR